MPRTAAFDAALAASVQNPVARLDLTAPDGTVKVTFTVVDGTVTYGRRKGTLTAQLTATVLDVDNVLGTGELTNLRQAAYGTAGDTFGGLGGTYGVFSTTVQTGALVPYGVEVRPYRGLRLPDGTTELIPLGVFRLVDVAWADTAAGSRQITLTCADRSLIVARNAWTAPYTVAVNTNYRDAIAALAADRLGPFWRPLVPLHVATGTETTPKLTYGTSPGGNPWDDVTTMARVCAAQVYFDRTGALVLTDTADPATAAPVWAFTTDEAGLLTEVDRGLLASKSYNGVVVSGENSSAAAPVRGEAWDADTTSPTFTDGQFGRAPLVVSTSLVTDPGQAQNLANVLLHELLGVWEEVRITFIPHPALEVGDVVQLSYPPLGIDHAYLIDSLTVPLRPDGLASATLRRRLADGEL